MTRRAVLFECDGSTCVGTLDDAPGTTALLIVTGGNEMRAGPWNSQATIAAEIAAAGYPVFRYDRRGVGDSEGTNMGFRGGLPDLAAALEAFHRECPHVRRVVAFGNCDAAATLMLAGGAGCAGLVLSNPWTLADLSALGVHYARRLRDPAALIRLLKGQISLGALMTSLHDMLRRRRSSSPATSLTDELRMGLARFRGPAWILLAENDNTAQVFLTRWDQRDPRLRHCPGASHNYVEPEAASWLRQQLLAALAEMSS